MTFIDNIIILLSWTLRNGMSIVGLYGVDTFIGNSVSLNAGLGRLRDFASIIACHEKTESNRVYCFQTLNTIIPKDVYERTMRVSIGMTCIRMLVFLFDTDKMS